MAFLRCDFRLLGQRFQLRSRSDAAGNVDRNARARGRGQRAVNMKRFALVAQWFKSLTDNVGKWWGITSGAFSIPFTFLALFNFPPRLLFAALAYISLWVLVIAQTRRISELQRPVPSPKVTVRVGHDLMDLAHGSYWIRGEVENTSEHRAESCRLKLLKIEGQNPRTPKHLWSKTALFNGKAAAVNRGASIRTKG